MQLVLQAVLDWMYKMVPSGRSRAAVCAARCRAAQWQSATWTGYAVTVRQTPPPLTALAAAAAALAPVLQKTPLLVVHKTGGIMPVVIAPAAAAVAVAARAVGVMSVLFVHLAGVTNRMGQVRQMVSKHPPVAGLRQMVQAS